MKQPYVIQMILLKKGDLQLNNLNDCRFFIIMRLFRYRLNSNIKSFLSKKSDRIVIFGQFKNQK